MSFLQLRTKQSSTNLLSFPTVTTQAVSNITSSSGTGNGTVVNTGGSALTARGFVYSSSTVNPTLSDSVVVEGGTTVGVFSASIGSLSSSTTYNVRAYATNAIGTGYGDAVTFTTSAAAGGGATNDWPLFQKNGFWSWRY